MKKTTMLYKDHKTLVFILLLILEMCCCVLLSVFSLRAIFHSPTDRIVCSISNLSKVKLFESETPLSSQMA